MTHIIIGAAMYAIGAITMAWYKSIPIDDLTVEEELDAIDHRIARLQDRRAGLVKKLESTYSAV